MNTDYSVGPAFIVKVGNETAYVRRKREPSDFQYVVILLLCSIASHWYFRLGTQSGSSIEK
jgi:hypothetical protein